MNHAVDGALSVYFTPVLPWQEQTWQQLVARYERLPHGLLFAGMQGIGKRAFVWRFVAWLLCDNRLEHTAAACGHCQSCQWLESGTHPDLQVLPLSSLPVSSDENDDAAKDKTAKSKKNSRTAENKKPAKSSIKVDDIRELQPFISQGSAGRRVCVIDNADTMTVAAANALLKTLEEPREGIHLILITDMATKLLPTIKSRVQQVAIDHIQQDRVKAYLADMIRSQGLVDLQASTDINQQIEQALKLANGAPLAALDMLSCDWYSYRETWIKVWLALRVGKRSSIAASDYWQKTLTLADFIQLSEFMLMDFCRQSMGITVLQQDLNLDSYESINSLNLEAIQAVMAVINDMKQAIQQNVQDKIAYDRMLTALASL